LHGLIEIAGDLVEDFLFGPNLELNVRLFFCEVNDGFEFCEGNHVLVSCFASFAGG
jgi:hypothetical protein